VKVIGLTGGIAVGKSEVARIFRKHHIPVFDADAAVHEIYQNGEGAKHLQSTFPTAIIDGTVDRKKLSEIIAGDPSKLRIVEKIIHPLVRKAEAEFLAHAKNNNQAIVIIDSPLLIETNHHKDMDVTILVDATRAVQIDRAMLRPYMTREKLAVIVSKQMPQDEKRKYSNYVIENNGSLEDLKNQTIAIIAKIRDI
jgi:dephospho-CoA kinase